MTHSDNSTTGTDSQEWIFGPVPPAPRATSPYRTQSEAAPVTDPAPPEIAEERGNPLLGLVVGLLLGLAVVIVGWGLHVQIGSGVRFAAPLAVLGLKLLVQPRR